MKRFLTLIYTIFFSIHVLSQISSTGYTLKINAPLGDQCTLETLKNYLNSNSSNLDPIEGFMTRNGHVMLLMPAMAHATLKILVV